FGVVAIDLDGDGVLDLATADLGMSRGVSVLRGGPNGTFHPEAHFADGEDAFGIVARDFDGDGQLDLAVTCNPGPDLGVLRGAGHLQFAIPTEVGISGKHGAIVAEDWNRDGRMDLVTTDTLGGAVNVFLGD